MECREIQLRLTDYEDGNLEPEVWEEIQAHLKSCKPCESFRARLNEVWKAVDQLPVQDPDPFARRRFFSKLNRKKSIIKSIAGAVAVSLLFFLFLSVNHLVSRNSLTTISASYLTDISSPFFSSSRILPDPSSSNTESGETPAELSSFDFGTIQGPIQETTFFEEESP